MATKVKLMKFLQEIRGYAEITNRRPTPRPAVLYLMELRAQASHIHVPKRKLAIATDHGSRTTSPLPVKITHLEAGESTLPVVVC